MSEFVPGVCLRIVLALNARSLPGKPFVDRSTSPPYNYLQIKAGTFAVVVANTSLPGVTNWNVCLLSNKGAWWAMLADFPRCVVVVAP